MHSMSKHDDVDNYVSFGKTNKISWPKHISTLSALNLAQLEYELT